MIEGGYKNLCCQREPPKSLISQSPILRARSLAQKQQHGDVHTRRMPGLLIMIMRHPDFSLFVSGIVVKPAWLPQMASSVVPVVVWVT